MTLYQFNRLDELEQLEAVWEYGALVGEREDEVNCYKLYRLMHFMWKWKWVKNTICGGMIFGHRRTRSIQIRGHDH